MKKVQISVPLDATTGVASLAFGALMAGVPGGLTYWHRFRVERVDLWGSDTITSESSNSLSVVLSASSSWDQPNFQVTDVGTIGNERPRVGFRLGVLDRARWFNTAATELLCLITGSPGTEVTVQATVELVSPVLS
jgi:hypothetical protein